MPSQDIVDAVKEIIGRYLITDELAINVIEQSKVEDNE